MKRQMHRQRRRGVALAVTSVALVGLLGACGGTTGDDAESPAPEASASAETSEPAEAGSKSPAEDAPATEEAEKSSEPASDEPVNYAKDPGTMLVYGQSVDTYGVITTVQEPEPKDLFPEWEGTIDSDLEGITVEITVENTLDVEIPITSVMGYSAFSGESEGEYLSNSEGDQEAPVDLPAGRTATWIETFAVEDADDVIFDVTTSTETDLTFFSQEHADQVKEWNENAPEGN